MSAYTNTREQFTTALLERPIPDDASNDWRTKATDLQGVLRKLAYHPAMVDTGNLAQTFMTPAISKNKIYFMWDFVGRTLGMLYSIPPTSSFSRTNQAWGDVKSRSSMAADLLLDTQPGMLDMMVDSTYPGQSDRPEIGDDLKAAARALKEH